MFTETVTDLAISHCLRAGGALCPPRAQMENSLTPVTDSLLYESSNWVYFHSLCAPPEMTIWRRITAANNIDPKGFFSGRPKQVNFDIQAAISRMFLHFRQGALDHFHD